MLHGQHLDLGLGNRQALLDAVLEGRIRGGLHVVRA